MPKAGQARVLSPDQFRQLLQTIETHRHPEKNALIMLISFKLGFRVQEIALLRLREVITLSQSYPGGYKINDVLALPKNFTKGARATDRRQHEPKRTSVRFTLDEFERLVKRIRSHALSGKAYHADHYYPPMTQPKGGKTRELPLVDTELRAAIKRYVDVRLLKNPKLKPDDPLILNQKGLPYSPNTL